MIKILFVCLGNICRSPMAQFVFKQMVEEKGLSDRFEIDSAATESYNEMCHAGIHHGTRDILKSMHVPFEEHYSRRIRPADYAHFDYILAMDDSNIEDVNAWNTFVNNITEIDTLRKYIRYLDPICTEIERNYSTSLVKTDDMRTMQQFLFNFWSKRSPMNPKQAFDDYIAAVRRVNMSFGTTGFPGYRSDRGYVFLKYGQPDKIMEVPDEPAARPYEIWHYYQVANQRDKKFVFMAPDRSSNDYQLIHSNMVGEINNPRWPMEIYSLVYGQGYDQGVDQTEYERGWGSHAVDLYNNPR